MFIILTYNKKAEKLKKLLQVIPNIRALNKFGVSLRDKNQEEKPLFEKRNTQSSPDSSDKTSFDSGYDSGYDSNTTLGDTKENDDNANQKNESSVISFFLPFLVIFLL